MTIKKCARYLFRMSTLCSKNEKDIVHIFEMNYDELTKTNTSPEGRK